VNKNELVFNILGISVTLLLIGGTGFSMNILNPVYAQPPATLGKPFLVEEGKITGQKSIGPNRTLFTFTTNGTLNDNIEVTNTGEAMTYSRGNNLGFDKGQGIISTNDGSEIANYTLIAVENMTRGGNLAFQGAMVYSTNSTGELSILDNTLSVFKGEVGPNLDSFANTHWEWK
jgi:hypothetical protein